MKTEKIISLFFTITFVILSFEFYAQNNAVLSPALSPSIDWASIYWPEQDMAGITTGQAGSDEDWFYDLIEHKVNGQSVGYVAVGFAGDRDFTSFTVRDTEDNIIDCYSRDNTELEDCEALSPQPDVKGFHRQLVVFYDHKGSVTGYFRYNFGDIYGVTQDVSGNLYLVGNAANPVNMTQADEFNLANEPHLGSAPIYYNPTTTNQQSFDPATFSFNCGTPDFAYKFNVIKISPFGQVIWNNFYGLPTSLSSTFERNGRGVSALIHNASLLVGGNSDLLVSGAVKRKKCLVSINPTTGFMTWNMNFNSSTDGVIYQVHKSGNNILISGQDNVGTNPSQGFVSRCTATANLHPSSFLSPNFYKRAGDAVASGIDPSNTVSLGMESKSTSAIIANGRVYWFLMANNQFGGSASGIAEGIVYEMSTAGAFLDVDLFGEIRAYDLWLSGVPTSDGGFATVTSRHSPAFFDTGTIPNRNTPLDVNAPQNGTIGDCLDEIDPDMECPAFTDPNSPFFKLLSTCVYIRKYSPNFTLQWDKIWDSSNNAIRTCYPGNFKQQECMYRIIQSSLDDGLLVCGNTSDNWDDGYLVKLRNDCGLVPFFEAQQNSGYVVDYTDGITDINANTTWTTPKKVLGKVRVKPGMVLTIQNTTVEFAAESSIPSMIEVEQNGRLIVEDALLTKAEDCEQYWGGIAVWGTTLLHQSAYNGNQYYQGRASLTSSVVEFASSGIRNWNPGFYDQAGGIIETKDSKFLNCKRGAEFVEYQNKSPSDINILTSDRSRFITTDFEVDANYITQEGNFHQVSMWSVNGVKFYGTNFINTQSQAESVARGRGIYSLDATYFVDEFCSSGFYDLFGNCTGTATPSRFEGFYRGVSNINSTTNRPVYIERSEFTKNLLGVHSEANFDMVVSDNFFQVGNLGLNPNLLDIPMFRNAGIGLERCSNYRVSFNSLSGLGSSVDRYGISIYNSGPYDNKVEGNSLSHLKFGSKGDGTNRDGTSKGLDFYCNLNTANERDFESTSDNPASNFNFRGISKIQGNFDFATNNTFSTSASPLPDRHFRVSNNSGSIGYYHKNLSVHTPVFFTVNQLFPNITGADNECETRGFELGKSNDEVVDLLPQYLETTELYFSLLDGGSTATMLADIAAASFANVDALSATLLDIAPFISDEAILAVIESPIFSVSTISTLLSSNPGSLANSEVENFISTNIEMAGTYEELSSTDTELLDARTQMEADLHAMGIALAQSNRDAIHTLIRDTMGYTLDDLIATRKGALDVANYYSNVFAHLQNGNASNGWNELLDIQSIHRMSDYQISEWGGVKTYYQFLENLQLQGRNIAQLSDVEKDELLSIAQNETAGIASTWSWNALCFHYGICKPGTAPPEPSEMFAYTSSPSSEAKADVQAELLVIPNPSDQYSVVQFITPQEGAYTLEVYDLNGRLVGDVLQGNGSTPLRINTGNFANGLYLCRLIKADGSPAGFTKIIVQH